MARWGVSHTGASIVRAEVQIDGPDLVSSVTTHGEAKDRPTQSAWDVGMRRRDCHEGQEDRGQIGQREMESLRCCGHRCSW